MKLIIEDEEGQRRIVPLDRDEITFGRLEDNTIQLPERNVSRHHARLVRQEGGYVIEDLGSDNGVRVNGARIQAPVAVGEGDRLSIGDFGVLLTESTDVHPPPLPEGPPVLHFVPEPPPLVPEPAPDLAAEVEQTAPRPIAPLVAEASPRLLVLDTRLAGREFVCGRSEVTIGRDPDADIVIRHRSVALLHARLRQTSTGDWQLVDLQGSGRVQVNGAPAAETDVRSGDVLKVGEVRLQFVGPGDLTPFPPERSRKGRIALLGGILLALAAGAGFWHTVARRRAAPPESPPPPLALGTVETPTTSRPGASATPLGPASPLGFLQAARAALDQRDPDRAVALLSNVKDRSLAADAAPLRRIARTEQLASRALKAAQRELDLGRPGAALKQLDAARNSKLFLAEIEALRGQARAALKAPAGRTPPRISPIAREEAQRLYADGRALYEKDQVGEATSRFTRCVQKDPEHARCHLMLGSSYAKQNQLDQAELHYRRFVDLAPVDDPAVPKVKKILEDSDNQKKSRAQVPLR